jgi:uncharacterized membrane protein YesL
MSDGPVVLKSAFSRWWSELITLTVLNVIWLGCQLVIILGPPATATMYAVAQRLAEGEHLFMRDVWADFRGVFWRAWQWGLANVVVVGIALGNFYAYRGFSGPGWGLLRLLWGSVLLSWLQVQVFYWPFFYEQEDRSLRTTLTNSAKMLLLNPGFALSIGLLHLVLAVAGVVTGFPLGMTLMAWFALLGTYTVRARLAAYRQGHAGR